MQKYKSPIKSTKTSLFGKENFYIELHNHGIEQQKKILPDLLKISDPTQAGS